MSNLMFCHLFIAKIANNGGNKYAFVNSVSVLLCNYTEIYIEHNLQNISLETV